MAKSVFSHPNSLKIALALGVLGLAVFIGGGAWYIEQNPAFSPRSIVAMIERPILAFQYASLAEAAPVSEEDAVSIPVLTYHRVISDSEDVANITRSRFEDQMITLKKAGWHAVTLEEFERFMRGEITLPERSFLLTFDDGTKDSYYPVDPILNALDYHAANFIIVERSRLPRTTYYVSPAEIQTMLDSGRWSIGSHSFDGHHPYPTDNASGTGIFFADLLWDGEKGRLETKEEFATRVMTDLTRAKYELEADYGVPMNSFAFPLGNETGINGANNYPEGSEMTARIADEEYEFGFLQLDRQRYTANFPRTLLARAQSPAESFIAWRIHVDHDWDGGRVLEILENSLPKDLPYEDDFSANRGWIPSWGNIELGRNNLTLASLPDTTSASTFLDGTALWDNYSFDAAVNWERGHVIVLADVVRSSTYHSCVFSPGMVKIQRTIDGTAETLAMREDPRIQYGSVNVGARVHDTTIECTWNFTSIVENHSRDFAGGIGLQTWDQTPGVADLQISSIIARPYGQ